MADQSCGICLVGVMDRLWFHQIVLFSEPNSILSSKTLRKITPTLPSCESLIINQSSMCSIPEDIEILSLASSGSFTTPKDDSDQKELYHKTNEEEAPKERPARSKINASKARSQSSSPSTVPSRRRSRNLKYSSSVTRLRKTMSCKSLIELEAEEIKGFTDLGFKFDNQNICPRMMSVLPGLQRLGRESDNIANDEKGENGDETEEEELVDDEEDQKKLGHGAFRPYLSDAWLIKRPDSPLLNLRVPRVSSAAEMKKHLRYWARTVASEIRQES